MKIKEHDIRPKEIQERYAELSARDAERYFDTRERTNIDCVACGATKGEKQFEKYGFSYAECPQCGTLYLTPRPPAEKFASFYRDSESSKYWAEVFFPTVAEVRRETIFRPRASKISNWCAANRITVNKLIDVGAGYGIFLDEWRRIAPGINAVAIEPSTHLAEECRKKSLKVIEEVAENSCGLDHWADLLTCFEVLEHVHDPLAFLKTLKKLVRPGGVIFLSAPCINGFDLKVLWDRSTQLSPPHHINFLSVKGFEALFERAGIRHVEVSTPGKLDVDIVRNAVSKYPSLLEGQGFIKALLDKRVAEDFQKFLVRNRLSSHAWIYGVNPE